MSKSRKKPDVADLSFEQALEELEALVRAMEGGQLPLDEAMGAYQRGTALARHCQGRLTEVEASIQVLEGDALKLLDPSALRGNGA